MHHQLPGLPYCRVVDLDGDGNPDLCGVNKSGKLIALKINDEELWRFLGRWRPTQDYNNDGFQDLLPVPRSHDVEKSIGCISGADGQMLWQRTLGVTFVFCPPLPNGDVDEDGIPDVFVLGQTDRKGRKEDTAVALHALSGSTGDEIWQTTLPRELWRRVFHWGSPDLHYGPLLACPDVDGDGCSDVYLRLMWEQRETKTWGVWRAVVSGRRGRLL